MLELMRKAFRTTMSGGNGKTYEMHFAFRSMEDMHKADDEWRAFCEVADMPRKIRKAAELGMGYSPDQNNPLENYSMDELSRELHNRGWRLIPAFVAKNLAAGLNYGFWAKEPNND